MLLSLAMVTQLRFWWTFSTFGVTFFRAFVIVWRCSKLFVRRFEISIVLILVLLFWIHLLLHLSALLLVGLTLALVAKMRFVANQVSFSLVCTTSAWRFVECARWLVSLFVKTFVVAI